MMSKLTFLLIACICTLGCVLALPIPLRPETNADRMARGLPPLPPRSLTKNISARQGFVPSGTDTAKRSLTSPNPPTSLTGRLQVRNKNGSPLGFVRNWSSGAPISGVNFLGPEEDLRVSFSFSSSDPHQFDILATNPNFPSPYYVGAAGGSASLGPKDLAHGSKNTLAFTNVHQTSAGATPAIISPVDSYVESAIWSIHPDTKKLTAQWINTGGSKPETTLVYDIRANSLFFVGDLDAFNKDNTGAIASAVELFLV